jgi:FkbM family methyltransferase
MAPEKDDFIGSTLGLETRVELKKTLDSISDPTLSISILQDLMKRGPKREVTIQSDGVILQMSESGSRYSWQIDDPRTAVACLVATGTYEPIETKILEHIAKRSKVVVDIGANVGYYSVELAKLLDTEGELLSFEPVEASFCQLRKNVELNHLEKTVRAFQLGLSNAISETRIFLPRISGSSAASLRILHPDEEFESQNIKISTLDYVVSSLGLTDCNLIKIDVEGGELQVIEGGIETISKFKPIVFAELLRKWSKAFSYNPNRVLQLLQELGYSCWGVSAELREVSIFEETDIETNFLFIHLDVLNETLESLRMAGVAFRAH